ncbi:unnamed protein product [Blumeria hordei]|uniref:Magnesium transporter protein 1 n=1 Tax=Blumeria hordei TaxID=2867405 RepID=A0A383V2C7_BLUHO|nr:unnamed protein product [Blumeria hordei]
MKISLRSIGFLLIAGCIAAKQKSEDNFSKFHSKSLSSAPLKLDDSIYGELTASPRNYSVAVLLTAMNPKFGCQLCREFQLEWDILSKSWTRGDRKGDSRLIFGTLDFTDGRNTFQSLGLQTAPVLLLFLPNQGTHSSANSSPLKLEFTSGSHSAEQTHAWISRHLQDGPRPKIVRPLNWKRLIAASTTALSVIAAISLAWPIIMPIIQNRNLWAALSLIAILLFTSGHMFNHIRKVPYVTSNNNGGISYFAGGFSAQYGLETQIIAAMYGLLSFATISLALKVPRILNPVAQQMAVLIWCGLIFFVYAFLLSIFRIKNGSYPFWLPPFP